MQARNSNIREFLEATKIFVVPVYQRNYDWKKDNCQRLFSDIVKVIQSGKQHFLGTVCFKVYSDLERSIIDGQQRLTSITLMLKAAYDYDPNDETLRDEINNSFFYNKGVEFDTDFRRIKLHPNRRDEEVYHVLLTSSIDEVNEKLTSVQKDSRIYLNYKLFYELIGDYVQRGGKVRDIVVALRNLTIVMLEVQDENPQEIFESLNSTGLDLTNVDLLRNFFLMQFPYKEQKELYEDYWIKVEDSIGAERMEQFFADFLVFKRRSDAITINGRRSHINEHNLYPSFKDYYASLSGDNDFEKTRSCFEDLKKAAELYKEFVFKDDVNLEKETPRRKKLYFLLSINDSSKARSLLLYIFDLHKQGIIDNKMLDEAIDGISSLTFRARICKAQGVDRQFAGNVMQRLHEVLEITEDRKNFIDVFWKSITAGKGSYAFPSDAEFTDALINKDLYTTLRSRGCKHLLYVIEAHSPFYKGLPSFDNDTISIEHIMPQKLSQRWKDSLNEETLANYGTALHRLGNLALTNQNGEMSNKSFDEKKAYYEETPYHYTRKIKEYTSWQIGDIDARSHELAMQALNIWKLPEQYQKSRDGSKSFYTLNEDTDFSFKKPSVLYVGSAEYHVKSWVDILATLCKHFDKESHEAFIEIATLDKNSWFCVEGDDKAKGRNFTKVLGNVYIRRMSAEDTLKAALKTSQDYDAIVGTNYAESILFALK